MTWATAGNALILLKAGEVADSYYVFYYEGRADWRVAMLFTQPEQILSAEDSTRKAIYERVEACHDWLEMAVKLDKIPPRPRDFVIFTSDNPGEARVFSPDFDGNANLEQALGSCLLMLGRLWPEWLPWWEWMGSPPTTFIYPDVGLEN